MTELTGLGDTMQAPVAFLPATQSTEQRTSTCTGHPTSRRKEAVVLASRGVCIAHTYGLLRPVPVSSAVTADEW